MCCEEHKDLESKLLKDVMPICFNVSVYHMDLKRKIAEDTILGAPLNTSQDNIPKSLNSSFDTSIV